MDKLIEERAPPVLKTYFSICNIFTCYDPSKGKKVELTRYSGLVLCGEKMKFHFATENHY